MRPLLAILPVVALSFNAGAQQAPGRRAVSPEERREIESALPAKAPAKPRQPRKLLIVDRVAGRLPDPCSIPAEGTQPQSPGRISGGGMSFVSPVPTSVNRRELG